MIQSRQTATWDSRTRKSPGPRPAHRRLRGYAFDPSLSMQMETALLNEVVFQVVWEPLVPRVVGGSKVPEPQVDRLEPGPVGE